MENDFDSWHDRQERIDDMFDESDLIIIQILSQYLHEREDGEA